MDAAALIKSAQDTWAESQEYAKQSKQFFATSADVSASIPKYGAAAKAAAARAAYDANPAWQPAPM